jgi:ABC-2 type transport system ATP-binding protein
MVVYMTYTVIARGISKSFDKQLVLDRVDLSIETASVLALLGPNGAGKTTMVRILATLIEPDDGNATIAGADLVADPAAVKRAISLTGQYAAVDELLTGEENLEMIARLRHLPRREARQRASELLAVFDLEGARDKRASHYSGGMKRRLDLAMSMVVPPQLLFLDEPTTGLDPYSREQLWRTVERLTDDGVTILLTTQYLDEADHLADTILVLDRGRVVAEGTSSELKAMLGSELLRLDFSDAQSYNRAKRILEPIRTDDRLRKIEVTTDASSAQVFATLALLEKAGVTAAKVEIHRPSLDDVFLSITGQADHESKEVA